MLLSKLEARKINRKGGGAKSGTTSGQNQRRAIMFAILEIIGYLFFGVLFVFMCFLQKHYKNRGFGIIILGFWGAKSRVNKWSTTGSISGPHLASNFWRQMWTTY